MSISLPTGDQHIDMLLVELSTLVTKHGKDSFQVQTFIEKHEDDSWMDQRTGMTHFFSEIAEPLSELMEGIENKEPGEDTEDPHAEWEAGADWWKNPTDEDES